MASRGQNTSLLLSRVKRLFLIRLQGYATVTVGLITQKQGTNLVTTKITNSQGVSVGCRLKNIIQ